MRVCKHGCGVKMFYFSRANHASTNLKKFSSSKFDKFTLFTHSFVGWNMENRYKEGESIFLRLSWHFKREKSVFWKASFCKTRTDYACKTSCTRLRLQLTWYGYVHCLHCIATFIAGLTSVFPKLTPANICELKQTSICALSTADLHPGNKGWRDTSCHAGQS